MKKADGILCGDLHLMEDTPICRTDNFQEAQWRKLTFIKQLQEEHDCPVLCAGDLLDFWKPSPFLLSKIIEHLPKQFYTVLGNHDLPQHSLELLEKSGIYTLQMAGSLEILKGTHWGQEKDVFTTIAGKEILIKHVMNYQRGHSPFPGCTDPSAEILLRKYRNCPLVLTGHNHKQFVVKSNTTLVVNPGAMTRQTADQIDFEPAVFLWYAEQNEVKRVVLPYEKSVVSREHIELVKERNDRINAFVSRLDTEWDAAISFEENIEIFMSKNPIRSEVKELIYKALEGVS